MNRLILLVICLLPALNACASDISTNVGASGQPATAVLDLPVPVLLSSALSARVSGGILSQRDAAELVKATVCASTACSDDRGVYVLINLVNWGQNGTSSNWYVFRGGNSTLSPWRAAQFDGGQRLFGAKRTLLLSIQVSPNYPAGTPKYTLTESKRVPTNFQHLSDLLGVVAPGGNKGGGELPKGGVFWTGGPVPRKFPTADIAIKTAIPRPAAPAKAIQDDPATPTSAAPSGSSAIESSPTQVLSPSSMGGPHADIDGVVQQQSGNKPQVPQPQPGNAPAPPAGGANKAAADVGADVAMPDYSVTDEAKSWWDVSVAVPITKASELQFNSTNNTVTATQVNKQNVFAVIDLYAPPRDLVGLTYSFVPHPLIGVSMASKPLHSLLFAGAIGLSFGEIYVGANLLKQQNVNGLAVGSTATSQQLSAATSQAFHAHFTIGINLSVKAAFNAAANGTKR